MTKSRNNENDDFIKSVDLGFTELVIHRRHIIARTAQGINANLEKHQQVVDTVESVLDGDYVWILDEVNSYSVELGPTLALRDNPRIIGVAVVAYRPLTEAVYQQGANLIKKPSAFFSDLEQAVVWARDLASKHS